jgi:lipoate-protein ligase A
MLSAPADGAQNMAVDHALLDRAATHDEAVLRLYAWQAPTVSLGLHEKARFDAARAAAEGLAVVRRPTGGRALLHHREVTYSVTAPAHGAAMREAYAIINRLLLAALQRLGVAAAEAPRRGRPLAPDGAACFAEPNVGEIVVDGRKLVGSAQRRDERAFLQHGSILLHDDQPRVAALRGAAPPPPAATLAAALGREVAPAELCACIVAAFDAETGGHAEPLHERDLAAAIDVHRATYRDARWTYRR